MAGTRVYELAREFGVDSKTVLDTARSLGLRIKSASSVVESSAAARLRKVFPSVDVRAGAGMPEAGKPDGSPVRIGLVLFAAEEFVPVDAARFQPERLDVDVVVMAVAGRHDASVVVPGVPVSALGDMDWRGAVSTAAADLMSSRVDGVGFTGIVDACDALRAIYGDAVVLTVGATAGVIGRFGFDWYPELRKALEDACILGTGPVRSVVEHDGKPDAGKAHDAQAWEDAGQREFLTYTFGDDGPALANHGDHGEAWPSLASPD